MDDIEFVGKFFLPGRSKKYSGRVIVYGQKAEIVLEVFGNESLGGEQIDPLNYSTISHQIILGSASYPKNLTLLDCRLLTIKTIGDDFFQLLYSIKTIIHHALFESNEGLVFKSVTVLVPYVSSWYDGWHSFKDKSTLSNNQGRKVQSLSVNNNLVISFIDEIHSRIKIIGISFETAFEKYVQFTYSKEEHFNNIITDIVQFTKLLEFACSKQVNFQLIEGEALRSKVINSAQNSPDDEFTYINFTNYTYIKDQNVHEGSLHQNFMLFSAWVIDKELLNRVITKWYENKEYYHIYDFYLDSNNWFEGTSAMLSNVMFNNRFLNLIQALEGYHKKQFDNFIPDSEEFKMKKAKVLALLNSNKELKQWTNNRLNFNKAPILIDRLNSLIKNSETILLELFEESRIFIDFPSQAKKYRDILSHGNLKRTFQGKELHSLFYMAQILLSICILQSLEFENKVILRLINHNENLQSNILEVKMNSPIDNTD